MTEMNNNPIPSHLSGFDWYAPHQAWLKSVGYKFQGDGSATPCRAVLSGADLRGAVLRGADLSRADLSGADLRGAVLRGADLSRADLSGADLRGADLRGAVLSRAVLSGADLRGVPLIEKLDSKILAAVQSPGNSLEMGTWHTCDTTHCIAGWAVQLAGAEGKALEDKFSTATAAALIYTKAGKRIPDFYCGNITAMEALQARAASESA